MTKTKPLSPPERRRLPAERPSITHHFKIHAKNEHTGEIDPISGYITVGFYDDERTVGEVFVKLDKQGSTVSGALDAWAIGTSMLLQCGVPLETVCDKYRGMRFEPSGRTDTPQIPYAQSAIDYVARYLQLRCLDRIDVMSPREAS